MKKTLQAALVALMLAPTGALAQDFEKGVEAAEAGDFALAVREWLPLVEQGHTQAQYNLAWLYEFGLGVPKNSAKALDLFRLAAEQGLAEAQFNLGVTYQNGIDVPQDYNEAAKWYRLAANQGDAKAQYNLGVIYSNGEGVPQDYAEAVVWYRLAAEQGNATAQLNLAETYNDGEGVPQDFVAAHVWANIASANGDADSAEIRDSIAQKMTPADISEAQRRARVCMASDYQDCD